MSGALPPVKISELPPYTGADNPDGTLPITIAGTTYGINTSKLGGSGGATPTLSQVTQQGPLPIFENGAGLRYFELADKSRINLCNNEGIEFSWDDLVEFPIGTNFYIDNIISPIPAKIISSTNNQIFFSATLMNESEIILEPSKRYRLTKYDDGTTSLLNGSWIVSYEESVPLGVTEMNVDKSLSIEDAYKPINVNSGGLNYNALTFTQTSGTFFTGRKYYIATYVAGDNFTNIGGTNASGTTFTAIGPTAVNYTNGSTIVDITTSNILPDNSTVVINNTIVPSTGAGLTLNFGIGCLVQANGTLLSGSTLIIPNGVKCFLNHLQDLSFTVTYEVGSISSGSSAVTSVNAQTGDVILNSDNIGDGTTYKQYSATEKTKLAGIASTYAPISTTPIILLNDNTTTSAVTGTTSNTILSSYLIPANTFATGDRILIDFVGLKSTTTATGSFNINVNTTNSLFGATKIAGMTGGGAGNRFYVCQRSIAFKSSTSFEILSLSVNNTHDLGVDNNAPATITYDTTQAYYLIISVAPSNSADSFNQSRITVTKLKSKTTF